jgi:predicted outer membrane repeat protein
MNTRKWGWMLAFGSLAVGLPGQSAVLRMRNNAPGPAHDGATWATAFTTLQAAVDAAAPGDEIWVGAVGETDTVTLKPNLSVYGGFSGNESARENRSGLTRMWAADEGVPAVIVPPAAVNVLLDSLMVSGGSPGFLFQAKDTTLNKCLITQCAGGIRCESGASVRITDTDIGDCSAPKGGGLWSEASNVRIERCRFIANPARNGAGSVGGAVFANGGQLTVRDTVFMQNSASVSGGALYATDALITLVNNTFLTNLASPDYPAQGDGAAVWVSGAQPALIANNIFADNALGLNTAQPFSPARVPVYIGGAAATVAGNLFSANRPEQPVGDDAGGNVWGNAALGPPWFDPAQAMLPRPSSMAINGGREEYVEFGELDYRRNPRKRGVRVDIGAVEADASDAPARLYARPDGSDGADGRTWATAKRTLQRAVNDAAPGGEVWAAGGIYDYTGPLFMRDRVGLYGGFRGLEASRSQRLDSGPPSILDARGQGRVVVIPSTASGVTLDGFTLWRGSGTTGGGVLSSGQESTISRCDIAGNTAVFGGGIGVIDGSITVQANRIEHNQASLEGPRAVTAGGGIFITQARAIVRANIVQENLARSRDTLSVSGPSSLTFASGAGLSFGDSDIAVDGNLFAGNRTDANSEFVTPLEGYAIHYGSAINGGGSGTVTITGNTMVANGNRSENSTYPLPGMESFLGTAGGAVNLDRLNYIPTLANNLIAFNSSGVNGSMSNAFYANDVYGNGTGSAPENYRGRTLEDPTWQRGNISKDPLLVDFAGGDYHLRLGSSARDAGDDSFVSDATDLDGLPRIQGARVDMGAYEARPVPAASMGQALNALRIAGGLSAATPPEADALTDDGRMDLADAVRLLRRAGGL